MKEFGRNSSEIDGKCNKDLIIHVSSCHTTTGHQVPPSLGSQRMPSPLCKPYFPTCEGLAMSMICLMTVGAAARGLNAGRSLPVGGCNLTRMLLGTAAWNSTLATLDTPEFITDTRTTFTLGPRSFWNGGEQHRVGKWTESESDQITILSPNCIV